MPLFEIVSSKINAGFTVCCQKATDVYLWSSLFLIFLFWFFPFLPLFLRKDGPSIPDSRRPRPAQVLLLRDIDSVVSANTGSFWLAGPGLCFEKIQYIQNFRFKMYWIFSISHPRTIFQMYRIFPKQNPVATIRKIPYFFFLTKSIACTCTGSFGLKILDFYVKTRYHSLAFKKLYYYWCMPLSNLISLVRVHATKRLWKSLSRHFQNWIARNDGFFNNAAKSN